MTAISFLYIFIFSCEYIYIKQFEARHFKDTIFTHTNTEVVVAEVVWLVNFQGRGEYGWSEAQMGITHSPLTQNNSNLPLPLFCGNNPIFLLDNIDEWLYMYINWFTLIIFFMIVYVKQKIGGNDNSPNSLNVMVNLHYHSENRAATGRIPSRYL